MTDLFMTEAERATLLREWNDTALDYPHDARVHDLVRAHAEQRPDAVAVVAADATFTFSELDEQVGRLARRLVAAGVRPRQRVVIVLDRVAALPVAVLAVLRTGAAYVPLDAGQAGSRTGHALADPGVTAVITRTELVADLPSCRVPVVLTDDAEQDDGLATDPAVEVGADWTACVVYTSGSTGTPKGVQISHGNLAGMYFGWAAAYRLPELSAHCQLLNFSFVVFQGDLVRALCSGAKLVICPLDTILDPVALHEVIESQRINFVEFVPSVLRGLVHHLGEIGARLNTVKLLVVGSDRWLYGEHRALAGIVGPNTRIVHSFGLTETTVDSAYFDGTDLSLADGQLTPIGRPFPNVRLYVLDADREPVGRGVVGELYIGGVGVTLGYLGDEQRTAERFVPDPFGGTGPLYRTGDLAKYLRDGNIQFLGRQDGQVKVRGFRVEFGEVEATLREHPGVRDVAVTGVAGADGSVELAAYVVPARHAADAGPASRRLVRLPDGREVVSVNDSETFQFYQELMVDDLYLRHGIDVRPGDIVFDVGANIGMFSLRVHQVTSDIEVYAFEPAPDIADALSANLASYGVNGRLLRCGLAEASGARELTFYRQSASMSSFYANEREERDVLAAIMRNQFEAAGADTETESYVDEWVAQRLVAETYRCQLRTVSEVMAETGVDHVDLLKIVVQKSEWDVLCGIADADWPKIGQLVLEVYDLDGRLARMRQFLAGKGYRVESEQAPLFAGSIVHLLYAVRPDHRAHRETSVVDVREVAVPPVSAKGLHEYLRGRLAEYMVPRKFAFVPELPVTTTGKVDRQAMPVGELIDLVGTAEYVEPRTDTERTLAQIWCDVLGVRQVGAEHDFFELGGHSLLATQVVSRARAAFSVDLPLRLFLQARTVGALAAEIDTIRQTAPAARPSTITRVDRGAYRRHASGSGPANEPAGEVCVFPCSSGQERLWFLQQVGASTAYTMPSALRLTGPLDLAALAGSIADLVRRHESLRTSIDSEDGRPKQVVHPDVDVWPTVVDLTGAGQDELDRLVQAELALPFDLRRPPLLRVVVYRLAEHEHVMLFMVHHILSDGWSMTVLLREVAQGYAMRSAGMPAALPEPAIQYPDYAVWQRNWLDSEAAHAQLQRWCKRLAGAPSTLEFPVDRPRQAQHSYRGARHRIQLDTELTRRLRTLADSTGTTLFMVLFAAFGVLLHRYTEQTDIVIGTPIANRHRAELEGLIGFLANTLALRVDLADEPTFRDLLGRVLDVASEAYDNQDLPFNVLVDALQLERDLARHPLFQVMFVLQNAPLRWPELAGLRIEQVELPGDTAKFDLQLQVLQRGEDLVADFEYATALFSEATVRGLAGHLVEVLEAVIEDPDVSVSLLPPSRPAVAPAAVAASGPAAHVPRLKGNE